MSHRHIIFVGQAAWRLAIVREGEVQLIELAPADGIPARVTLVKETLNARGYAGQPLLLAVPSGWCLNAMISTDKLGRGDRRASMAFRLEEHLPISAEDFVADYVELGDGQVLGVCGELLKLRELVNAFSAAGLPIQHISALGLLAAAHIAHLHSDAQTVITHMEEADAGCDMIQLQKGRPARWEWFAPDDPALISRLAETRAAQAGAGKVYTLGLRSAHSQAATYKLNGSSALVADLSGERAAALEAARVLDGTAWPWIEFRRDALAITHRQPFQNKPLRALVLAILLLLACLVAVAQWRGRAYQAVALERQHQQAEIFKRLFPDQRVPAAVKARLLDEYKKLAALQGTTGEGTPVDTASALVVMRDFLKNLPSDVPFQIEDIDFQTDYIRVEGKARSHVDAERLTVALGQSGTLEIEPPRTQTLKEGGVSFTFVARPHNLATQKGAP